MSVYKIQQKARTTSTNIHPIHNDDISPQQVTTNTPALANNANVLDISTMSSQITSGETKTSETISSSANTTVLLNEPGKWKIFLGHTRRNGDATTLVNETYYEAEKLDISS